MAILCSPVSTQLDGGEGHREARHVQRCSWQPGAAGNDPRGARCIRPAADWRSGARGGAACAQCLEALEAPANAVDLLPRRDVLYRASQGHTTPVPLACQVPGSALAPIDL
jgi:hypothetical protein